VRAMLLSRNVTSRVPNVGVTATLENCQAGATDALASISVPVCR